MRPGVRVFQHLVAGLLHPGQLVSGAHGGSESMPSWFLLQLTVHQGRVQSYLLLCSWVNWTSDLCCGFFLYRFLFPGHLCVHQLLPCRIHCYEQMCSWFVLQHHFFAGGLQFHVLLPPGDNCTGHLRPRLCVHHPCFQVGVRFNELVSAWDCIGEPLFIWLLLCDPLVQGELHLP